MKRPPGGGLGGVLGGGAYENESSLGTETAQIYANVLVPFRGFRSCSLRSFKYLAGGVLVRDEGVAGSNPATPTNKNKHLEN
jgi:hypothetical protein